MKLLLEYWRHWINEATVESKKLYHGAHEPIKDLDLSLHSEGHGVGSLYTFNEATLGDKAIKFAAAWSVDEAGHRDAPTVYEFEVDGLIVDLTKDDNSPEYEKFARVFEKRFGKNKEELKKILGEQDLYNYIDYNLDFRNMLVANGIDGVSFIDGLDERGFVNYTGTDKPPVTVIFNLPKLKKTGVYSVEQRWLDDDIEDKKKLARLREPRSWTDSEMWSDTKSLGFKNLIIKKVK